MTSKQTNNSKRRIVKCVSCNLRKPHHAQGKCSLCYIAGKREDKKRREQYTI